MNKKRMFSLLLSVFVLLAAILGGCGTSKAPVNAVRSDSSVSKGSDMHYSAPMEGIAINETPASYVVTEAEKAAPEGASGGSGLSEMPAAAGRKLIRTAALTVETQDYDKSVKEIQAMTARFGGYIENASTDGGRSAGGSSRTRYASFVLRIPADSLDAFHEAAAELGNITSRSENVRDITLNYTDTASRVKALEAQRDSLIEMMGKAETLEDLLTIQDHLTSVEYQLESYASQLRSYDNQVEYSTVSLSLQEVKIYTEPEPESFGDRLVQSFKESLKNVGEFFKNAALFIVGNLPSILVLAAFVTAAILFIRRLAKKAAAALKGKKKTEEETKSENN